jgi:hypothetical protein
MTIRTGLNNHVEMVHRPGEAHLAVKLLALLGCEPLTSPTPFAGATWHFSKDQTLWVSEATPEQWAFELWLQAQLEKHGAGDAQAFVARLAALPQRHSHFGLGLVSLEDWEALVARIEDAAAGDPDLKGRISLPVRQRPGDPGSVAEESEGKMGRTLYQAFLRTDILSTGLLTLGQAIEIQHYRENDPSYTGEFKRLEAVGA